MPRNKFITFLYLILCFHTSDCSYCGCGPMYSCRVIPFS